MCVHYSIEFVVFFWLKWHIIDASLERFPSAKTPNFPGACGRSTPLAALPPAATAASDFVFNWVGDHAFNPSCPPHTHILHGCRSNSCWFCASQVLPLQLRALLPSVLFVLLSVACLPRCLLAGQVPAEQCRKPTQEIWCKKWEIHLI